MIEFGKVELTEAQRKKWRVNCGDFLVILKDGIKLSDTLYRKGGLGGEFKYGYILLLKYTEQFYDDSITKDKDQKRHLSGSWCILNKDGEEKVNFDSYKSPYLCGGLIYSLDNKYYNIETGYFYGGSYSNFLYSKKFIFLDNNMYGGDESKRGIIKINKFDGSFELFT